MARRKQLAITERQFEVLNILWEHGPLTVREIRDHIEGRGREDLPYTTVLGLMQVMEREGLVAHDVETTTHRYRPLLTRQDGTSSLLTDFVQRFFRGAAKKLVLGLVDASQLSVEDLRELEERLKRGDSANEGRAADAGSADSDRHGAKKKSRRRST
jgi:predicted transcriptional regulator